MSMFSQTCDRLRDYLKDRPEASSAITPLFQRTAPNNDDDDQLLLMPKQMTIFYAGRVIVLENVSSHTADQLIRIAANLASSSPPSPPQSPSANMSSNLLCGADMSQTRTRSLTRFFEKRKDRIKGRAPYTLSDKQQVDKSWLSLSAAAAKH